MNTRPRGIIAPFLLLLAISTPALAQSVRGKVLDPDKRPVADADVLIMRGDAVAATASTTNDGQFGPVELPAGDYTVTAAAPGLGAAFKPVSVKAGAPTEVSVALTVSAVQETVVVSASPVETPLSRTTDSVTVIDRAEIEAAQTHTVADALRLVPGFHVAASGGIGALTSIFPRGGESDYTLLLVDGIAQNGFGGAFDAGHLDTAGLDRIEVVRGPKSALYGNGAIGGLVHVISRQGGPIRGQASFEGGGYGFLRSTASASGSRGSLRWGGSVDRLKNDGDTREMATIGRRVANDDYERTVAAGSFGWSDRPSRVVRVDVRGGRNIKGFPGPYGSDPAHLYSGLDLISRGRTTSKSVGVSGVFGNLAPGRHSMQFTWSKAKSEFTSPYGASTDENGRITSRYEFDRELRTLGLSAGVELLREQVNNTFITGTLFQPIPVTRSVAGMFAEGRPSFGDRLLLTVGARLERIARSSLELSLGSHPALADDVIWSFNPKVSAAFFVRPNAANWTKIRASAGTGIKPPTGFEIAYTDNPSLKPERSQSVDAGVEQAIGRAVSIDATWFFNHYDDLIVAVGTGISGASRYKTDNIANAQASGLETGVHWRHRSGLAVRGGWTWLKTEVLGIDQFPEAGFGPYKVGQPLIRRPRHQAFGELTWTGGRGSAFLTIGGRGPMSDLEPNYASSLVTNRGYATTALGGSVRIGRHVEAFGRVSNAFDTSYEEVFGFPAMGRTASIGVRIAAGR
jgi:outer membrane cobalamin receptor